MTAESSQPVRSRRWLQFRLATLLVAMTAIACWLGYYFSPAKRAERAARALQKSGVRVLYDYQRAPGKRGPGTPSWKSVKPSFAAKAKPPGPPLVRQIVGEGFFQNAESISLGHQPLTAEQLAPLRQLPDVRQLFLTDCEIGDEHLAHLAPLQKLTELGLHNNKLTDAGLAHLAGLTQLKTASLTKNQIGGAGLANLNGMTGLKQLFLQDNPITDEGLVHLGKIESLEMLVLAGTQITDDGLKHLAGLKNLKYLGLTRTKITRPAIDALQLALPQCELEWFPPRGP